MRKMALLLLLATSCVAEAQVEVRVSGDGGTSSTPDPALPTEPVAASGGALSPDEVCEVRDAIVAALRESAEVWASALADETAGADCRLAEDGTAHIGLWRITACVEECDGQPLRALYRAAGSQVPSYAAEVVRQGEGFLCTDLGQFMVVP
jgi:hypothetical protein